MVGPRCDQQAAEATMSAEYSSTPDLFKYRPLNDRSVCIERKGNLQPCDDIRAQWLIPWKFLLIVG